MRSLSSLLLSSGGGALGGECPSSFALVVAPALPPPPILRLGLWGPAVTQGRRALPSGLRSHCPSDSRAATARARRWRRPVLPRGVPAGLTSGSAARCREYCGGGSPRRRWPTIDPCGSRHLGIGSRRLIPPAQAPARGWACRPAPPRRWDRGKIRSASCCRAPGALPRWTPRRRSSPRRHWERQAPDSPSQLGRSRGAWSTP